MNNSCEEIVFFLLTSERLPASTVLHQLQLNLLHYRLDRRNSSEDTRE